MSDDTSVYGLQRIDYSKPERRLQSFEGWPLTVGPTVQQLVEAGFYYTGESDKVVCFDCKGGVYEWDPSDNAIEEHFKHYPNCEYIKKVVSGNQ